MLAEEQHTDMNAQHPPLVRSTANPSPLRRPGAIRRTSSIDVQWPDGNPQGLRHFHGRAREVIGARVLAEATMLAGLDFERMIVSMAAEPAPARLGELVGEKGGGHLRMIMAAKLPELIASGDPLYLLLDDISGVSLISNWGWAMHNREWFTELNAQMPAETLAKLMDARADVCWGLQRGNSGMNPDRESMNREAADAGELRNPADPEGWHGFPPCPGVSFRRARRIDVWRGEDGLLQVESSFQDSAPRPEGGRGALHEYVLRATVDPASMELLSLEPEPRVLPFWECPGAVTNAKAALVGTSLHDVRASVLGNLRGPLGCTHLNDALRALAEVPMLAAKLSLVESDHNQTP